MAGPSWLANIPMFDQTYRCGSASRSVRANRSSLKKKKKRRFGKRDRARWVWGREGERKKSRLLDIWEKAGERKRIDEWYGARNRR